MAIQLRVPIAAATLGREVQKTPQGPDHIDVARIAARFSWGELQFSAKDVMRLAIAPDEDAKRRILRPGFGFAMIVAVVAVFG